jgi:hypothetical protein
MPYRCARCEGSSVQGEESSAVSGHIRDIFAEEPGLYETKQPYLLPFSSGAYRDRTGDLRLAKPALSQLS